MTTQDIVDSFYSILQNSQDTEFRLAEFIKVLDSKLDSVMFSDKYLERQILNIEYNTWMLIYQFYIVETFQPDESHSESSLHYLLGEFKQDREFLCTLCVMNWVEQISWLSTSKQFRGGWNNSLTDYISRPDEQPRFDPDGVFNGTKLNTEDTKEEKQLLSEVFSLIRCGNLAGAQELLISSNQAWRALTIGGALPYFNFSLGSYQEKLRLPSVMQTLEKQENCESLDNSVSEDFEMGNTDVDLYMNACWMLSEQKRPELNEASCYEKAIYGSLCGNFNAIVGVCRETIYDFFWAMVRTLFVFQLRNKLRNYNEKYSSAQATEEEFYTNFSVPKHMPPEWDSAFESILRRLQQHFPDEFRFGFTKFQFLTIGGIIDGNWNAIFEYLWDLSSMVPEEDIVQCHSVQRFSAHLAILLLKTPEIEISPGKQQRAQVLVYRYLKCLIGNVKLKVVLYYCRFISDEEIYTKLLGRLLDSCSAPKEREACFKVVKDYCKVSFHRVICKVIKSKFVKELPELSSELVVQAMEPSKETKEIEAILDRIEEIPDESQEGLELLKHLLMNCMISPARKLISKFREVPRFWTVFLNSLEAYKDYYKENNSDYIQELQLHSMEERGADILASRRLGNNPQARYEQQQLMLQSISSNLLVMLKKLTSDKAIIAGEDFVEKWVSLLVCWGGEVCSTLQRKEDCEYFKEQLSNFTEVINMDKLQQTMSYLEEVSNTIPN